MTDEHESEAGSVMTNAMYTSIQNAINAMSEDMRLLWACGAPLAVEPMEDNRVRLVIKKGKVHRLEDGRIVVGFHDKDGDLYTRIIQPVERRGSGAMMFPVITTLKQGQNE